METRQGCRAFVLVFLGSVVGPSVVGSSAAFTTGDRREVTSEGEGVGCRYGKERGLPALI